ncbi:MAG TPA: MFS transporter [Anaerolineae bacterium]|nr:MFS transporter [Anaerolineae bacterium]
MLHKKFPFTNPIPHITHHHWPQKLPFFYGWIMLPLAIITMVATGPGQTFIISVFNPFWRESLNLTHSQLTGAYMLGTLIAATPQPFIGKWMDQWGIRRVILLVITGLGLACLLASQAQNLLMLLLAFIFLRMFGQGALSLLANNILAMWFRQRLGLVSALQSIGVSALNGLIPSAILWFTYQYGWRWSYAFLGLTVWLGLTPLIIIIFRNKPEDIDQLLDGQTILPNLTINPTPTNDFTLAMARRTPAFWIMLTATAAWGMIATAVYFNIIPLFTSQGLSEEAATATYATLSFATIIVQLLTGFLADRIPLRWLIASGLLSICLAVFSLTQLHSILVGHAYALFMGTGQALFGVSGNTLWARYYGRAHLGRIRSTVWMAVVASSSVGPFFMGFLYDQLNSYQIPLFLFIIILIPITLAMFWATPPTTT